MFASSSVGKLKSGWGWTVKNEALDEVVRFLRVSARERLSEETLPSSQSALSRGEKRLIGLLPPWLRVGRHPHFHQLLGRLVQAEAAEQGPEGGQHF